MENRPPDDASWKISQVAGPGGLERLPEHRARHALALRMVAGAGSPWIARRIPVARGEGGAVGSGGRVSRPPRGRARPRPTTSAAPTTSSRRAAPAKASPAKTAPAKHAKTKHDKAKPRARRQQSGPGLPQLFPGRRALLGLAGVVVLGLAVYFVSSASSLFAVRELEISGVTADVAADVRAALEPVQGESLVGLDLDRLEGHVAAVPTVAGVSFDRAFPHTLRVRVVPERVVAVVRQGKVGFLVAASGRVVASIARGTAVGLPRIWTARTERLVL
ncbi:MAG: FtsQ-type POTRA domain-containing protein, partial [Actinobacteria bacterium]|nr:FtsQ-type POTRA domain-containing protein [Actinomycetota bacterium]